MPSSALDGYPLTAARSPRAGCTVERLGAVRFGMAYFDISETFRSRVKLRDSQPHFDNLSRLAMLLTENDPEQRLMKAEVFRELGHFKIAGEGL